jgi:hypothetical protein
MEEEVTHESVIPATAGSALKQRQLVIHGLCFPDPRQQQRPWIPAYAGMTGQPRIDHDIHP